MKIKTIFAGALILCSMHLFARGDQELIPAGHWIYDCIERISLEQGTVNFADCAPLTISEIKVYLEEIEESEDCNLSKESLEYLQKIYDYFDYRPIGFNSDIMRIGMEPSFNLSGFFKTNDDIDWVYDRYERKPVILAPLSITVSDYMTFKMDLSLGMNKNTAIQNNRYSNVPVSADDIDINFPDDGYFSTGLKITDQTGVAFVLGKGERNIGRSLTGSIIWSEYMTGAAYGELNVYSPSIKYTGAVTQFNVDRYMYTHQIDTRFFKKFQFTVLEGMFVNAPMELLFLNPFTVFHGMAPWREYDNKSYDSESHTCAYLGLKFQYTPIRNLKFYGLYAMTQFQTSYETSNYKDDTTPNGIGGQLGSLYSIPLKKGRLHFALEGSYVQPYLYIKESPNWSLVRTYCENMGSKKYPFYEWIGSPFGPDTISGEFKAGYDSAAKFSVDLIYLFMARGEMSGTRVFTSMVNPDGRYSWGGLYTGTDVPDGWCYPGSNGMSQEEAKKRQGWVTPTGIPEYVNRISVRGTYDMDSIVEFTLQPSFVFIYNRNHNEGSFASGFELAGACSIKL